jgi:hypothetical protein
MWRVGFLLQREVHALLCAPHVPTPISIFPEAGRTAPRRKSKFDPVCCDRIASDCS